MKTLINILKVLGCLVFFMPGYAGASVSSKYNIAEELFRDFEYFKGVKPDSQQTMDNGGFFYRCYGDRGCYGVSNKSKDVGYYSREIGVNEWSRVGSIEELKDRFQRPRLAIFGKLVGKLSKDLSEQAYISSTNVAVPLIVHPGRLRGAQARRVVGAYESGLAIIMLDARQKDIARLRSILGLNVVQSTGQNNQYLLYAISKASSKSNINEFVIPADSKVVIEGFNLDGNGKKVMLPVWKGEKANFVSDFLRWVMDAEASGANLKSSIQRVSASTITDDLEKIAQKTEGVFRFNNGKNAHQIITTVQGVYDADDKQYWFVVNQRLQLSAANDVEVNNDNDRRWYTSNYYITSYPSNWQNTTEVVLDQSKPFTTQLNKAVNETFGWTLTGNLSYTAEYGAGAGVSGGVSYSKQISWEVPDVEVQNKATGNTTYWQYNIKQTASCGAFSCSFDGPLPNVAQATFQPSHIWLWKVGTSVQEKDGDAFGIWMYGTSSQGNGIVRGGIIPKYNISYRSFPWSTYFLAVPWPNKKQ